MTVEQLIGKIQDGTIYGCGLADLKVPLHLRDTKFAEFGAFIVKRNITNDLIGDHMKEFLDKNNRKIADGHALVCANTAENFFFTTDLLEFYLRHDIKIEKIHVFYEYKPSTAVSQFIDTVTKYRRMADLDPSKKAAGDNFKLNGNSCYGKSIFSYCFVSFYQQLSNFRKVY